MWKIEDKNPTIDQISSIGNKYLVGNGYLGIRGTLAEYEKSEFPAINLSGIYDRVGDGWREPLNAPNGLFTYLVVDGKTYRLPSVEPAEHNISLDFRHGIFSRNTSWNTDKGIVWVKAEHFACYERPHLIAMRYSVCCNFEGDVQLYTGIDGAVWDINGPHYDEMALGLEEELLKAVALTHEKKDSVCVSEGIYPDFTQVQEVEISEQRILRKLTFSAQKDKVYTLDKWIGVYTSQDCKDYEQKCEDQVREGMKEGYLVTLSKHKDAWEKKWEICEIEIEGDEQAREAINYSIYHLLCIAPRHSKSLSIAARGLSGQTYKGAVFWDTEMFMLDFFLYTDPAVAKTLLSYRIDTLEGAKEKARTYGYHGAFYAWESQENGYDACSDYNVTDVFTGRPMRTYFKDKQVHISSAVVYGIMKYVNYTGQTDLLSEGGAEVILEAARFYYDLLIKRVNHSRYEIHDVIGPDEYHERVNNNAYTNRMAKYVFESALYILDLLENDQLVLTRTLSSELKLQELRTEFEDAVQNIYIPKPSECNGVIEQFDGYMELEDVALEDLKKRLLNEKEYWGGAYGIATHTKIIKQADVITMMNLFSEDYSREVLLDNWNYYEPRTEHGSSLSACMYSLLACKCQMADKAYPFFMKSSLSDLKGGGKEWAGLIYIGGTHPASSGGAYMTLTQGFGGVRHKDGALGSTPQLPKGWARLSFKMIYKGELHRITITEAGAEIEKL